MGVRTFTAAAYARSMKMLLPPGRLWSLEPDSVLSSVLLASGDELARVSQRAADLVREGDPQTTDELLAEFERDLGLGHDGTLKERRARVVARLVRRQRVRPADYKLALAPILGLDPDDVEVIERSRSDAIAMNEDREIYRFFIYRDPEIAGSYDVEQAQDLVDDMAHSHTQGHVIESIDFACDDAHSLCDRDILGV